jgi:formylglycine-generating enzyme required for sulfatase activity
MPAIFVSWDDAQQYVAWLSKVTGKTYRLLTEAEYEYVARAGTTTSYSWGDDIGHAANANCDGCGSRREDAKQTSPVGSYPPNVFGLYDMLGNVFEWVEDCYHANYARAPEDGSAWITGGGCSNRVIRGGAWDSTPDSVRSAARSRSNALNQDFDLGFRVARTLAVP